MIYLGESNLNETFFTLTLSLTFFSSMIPGIITGLLLIDISETFNSNIGMVSQIRSTASLLGIIAALIIGVLSVRFNPKHLLLVGLGMYLIVGVGSWIAPTLSLLFLVYSFSGLGGGITSPMVQTMLAYLPSQKRAKAMGYLVASGSIAYLVSTPIVGYLNENSSWRTAFLYYQVPIILISLLLSIRFLPGSNTGNRGGLSYKEGIKQILGSCSAYSCLLGALLGSVCWIGFLTFGTSYLRAEFGISVMTASLVMVFTSGSFTLGSISSGSFVNRYGRRNVTIVGAVFLGLFLAVCTFIPSFIPCVVVMCVGCFFGGLRFSGANGMSLEQVPDYNGVMMSFHSASLNVGYLIGTAIGGFSLINYGWNLLSVSLGSAGLLAAVVYWFFTVEPEGES